MKPARCTIAEHEALKRDSERWVELPVLGVQRGEDGDPDCELRTCACGSVLCKLIEVRS